MPISSARLREGGRQMRARPRRHLVHLLALSARDGVGQRDEGKLVHLVQLGELLRVGLEGVGDDRDRGQPSFL